MPTPRTEPSHIVHFAPRADAAGQKIRFASRMTDDPERFRRAIESLIAIDDPIDRLGHGTAVEIGRAHV